MSKREMMSYVCSKGCSTNFYHVLSYSISLRTLCLSLVVSSLSSNCHFAVCRRKEIQSLRIMPGCQTGWSTALTIGATLCRRAATLTMFSRQLLSILPVVIGCSIIMMISNQGVGYRAASPILGWIGAHIWNTDKDHYLVLIPRLMNIVDSDIMDGITNTNTASSGEGNDGGDDGLNYNVALARSRETAGRGVRMSSTRCHTSLHMPALKYYWGEQPSPGCANTLSTRNMQHTGGCPIASWRWVLSLMLWVESVRIVLIHLLRLAK